MTAFFLSPKRFLLLFVLASAIVFAANFPTSLLHSDAVSIVELSENKLVQLELVISAGDIAAVHAHYTEHLTWLPNVGKDSRPENRHTNAWTNDYAVGYWLSGSPEDLPEMLRRLKVVFDPIDLPVDVAETERDIILREYDWRMANNPDAQAAEEMEAFLYEGNAIAARSEERRVGKEC